MTAFTFKVEVAFDSGFSTLEGSRTWTNVTTYVDAALGCEISYGRADELSTPDPNTLTVAFNNDDGRFTPGKSSSPYYPNVKKGKPIRVTVTYVGVDYIRFTGYINEWPVSWPTGGQERSQVVVTAVSRRARLGQTAPLTSAIRAAYLATSPTTYWPMDEEYGTIPEFPDGLYFRDVSNLVDNPNPAKREYITTFWDSAALQPVIHDGTAGPTDEQSLVKMGSFSDGALLAGFPHYVGGGGVMSINTAGEATAEVVARLGSPRGDNWVVDPLRILTSDLSRYIYVTVADLGSGSIRLGMALSYSDPITGAVVEVPSVVLDGPPVTTGLLDGGLHHFAVTLTGANTAELFLDGVSYGTCSLTGGRTVDVPLTTIAMGDATYLMDLWIGHAATHDRALTDPEILAHAQAAIAANETTSTRVTRIAGRVGVPSAEVDVETTIAGELGPQPEAGRSATEVLDELAISTGGVLYDTRAGHLAMQARNHRYNLASSFSLSAASQEVEVDLTVVDDHRYTKNIIEYARAGSGDSTVTVTDQDSIDDYGDFNPGAYTVVSGSDTEVESFAQDLLLRYADPAPRVPTISVDLVDLSNAQRALVLAADVGTRFGISGLPAQAPTDPMYLFFEGASESISVNAHTMTINTTPADLYQNVFIWNDATRGKWDSANVWAY